MDMPTHKRRRLSSTSVASSCESKTRQKINKTLPESKTCQKTNNNVSHHLRIQKNFKIYSHQPGQDFDPYFINDISTMIEYLYTPSNACSSIMAFKFANTAFVFNSSRPIKPRLINTISIMLQSEIVIS